MIKQKNLYKLAVIFALFLIPISALAQVTGFNPNKLIEDKVFSDTATFGGAAGIQKFLESKNSVLANTSPDFIARLKEPSVALLKQGLDDPGANLGRLRTAAELIWDAAQSSGLNPQVILVTLQKEQGLITNHQNDAEATLQKALDHSLGFDCPDSSGCGNLFPGFYYQLFGNFDAEGNRYLGAAKSLMKSFNTPGGRGPSYNGQVSHVGDTITIYNTQGPPNNAPESQQVTIESSATAALYRYTPHVYNGNYNFWKYMNEWFRYPNGTLVKLGTDSTVYIIQNGTRQLVPAFVASARGLNLASSITVSTTELESYPQDKIYGPADNTIVKATDSAQLYVFIANVKHPASEFVIQQRGLNSATALPLTPAESAMFEQGSTLTPKDGTVLRGQNQQAIYLVDNGSLKLYSAFVFGQRKAGKQVQVIPDSEVDSYPKAGFVPPLDGTLVKADNSLTIYLIGEGQKHPVSGSVFKNRKFSFKNVVTLSKDEVAGIVSGSFAQPGEKSWFKIAQTGSLYLFKEGTKHPISSFVAGQRHVTADFSVDQGEAGGWADGIGVPPLDNTLMRGDKDLTIYLVKGGQLKGLTAQAFKNKRYSLKNVKVLPQAEVDAYAKGDTIVK
jgi:hypothetical protein